MAKFHLHIMDGVEKEMEMDFPDDQEAVNCALNALSQFACRRFLPPTSVTIEVTDGARARIATLRMEFSVDYAQSPQPVH